MDFTEQLITTEKYSINIYTNNVQNPKKVWLVLPPGARDASFINYYMDLFDKSDLLIVPDYPGRGKSGRYGGESFQAIAESLVQLATELKLREINIIAYSFGTMIAVQIALQKSDIISHMYLFAHGEVLSSIPRFFLNLLFSLPTRFNFLYNAYRTLLLKLNIFEIFPTQNLDLINLQWLDALNYRFPNNIIDIPIDMFVFKKDTILNSNSLKKAKKIFNNLTISYIDAKHPTLNRDFLNLREALSLIVKV